MISLLKSVIKKHPRDLYTDLVLTVMMAAFTVIGVLTYIYAQTPQERILGIVLAIVFAVIGIGPLLFAGIALVERSKRRRTTNN